ncbi:hypothetical protein SHKM778_19680 [Streptomyces sp. KM77-8]|uniref:Phosphodiesterase n=1 Tax=Streptomyces haneummycinicus TaxID=3074435 RepID=A0AAT9HDY9_9ACTN
MSRRPKDPERSPPGGTGERTHPDLPARGALRQQPAPTALLSGTPAVVRRPGPVAQLVLALVCGAYAVGAACGWGSERLALIMGDFGLSAAAGTAAVSCFLYGRSPRTRFRPAWLMFGLSSAMASLGNLVWGWYEVVLGLPVPTPSYADLFFLCFAPPAIVGLLVLAKRPVSKAGWVCLALDAWLIGGSLLTLAWSLALAQAAKAEGPGVAHTALSLAYPLLDIALVSMVLALHFRRSAVNRSAVNTAIGALALTVMCDALFTSPLLHADYSSGQLLDAGWFAGSLLLAYAPWAAPRGGRPEREGTAVWSASTCPDGTAHRTTTTDRRPASPPGIRSPGPSPALSPRSPRTLPPPYAPSGSSTTSSTGAASTASC